MLNHLIFLAPPRPTLLYCSGRGSSYFYSLKCHCYVGKIIIEYKLWIPSFGHWWRGADSLQKSQPLWPGGKRSYRLETCQRGWEKEGNDLRASARLPYPYVLSEGMCTYVVSLICDQARSSILTENIIVALIQQLFDGMNWWYGGNEVPLKV